MVSPPILFQYRQTAELLAGEYEFTVQRLPLTPDKNVNPSATYYFRTITSFADITEEDYSSAIVEVPEFQLYLQSGAGGPFMRDSVQMGKFLDNLPYEFAIDPERDPNKFLGSVKGVLRQTPSLLGKNDITITIIVAAQELNDKAFTDSLKKGYARE